MKKVSLFILAIVASFFSGFAFKTMIENQSEGKSAMKKVTGIGGVFFKCKDPKTLREWYQRNLGLKAQNT